MRIQHFLLKDGLSWETGEWISFLPQKLSSTPIKRIDKYVQEQDMYLYILYMRVPRETGECVSFLHYIIKIHKVCVRYILLYWSNHYLSCQCYFLLFYRLLFKCFILGLLLFTLFLLLFHM